MEKIGGVRTLMHRADCVVSDPLECENEKRHLGKVLKMNGYPENVLSSKKLSRDESTSSKDNAHVEQKRTPPVVIPYVKGVSEHIRRVLHRYNVQAFFKPVNTLRQFLVRPKDPIDKQRVIGHVYTRSSVMTVMRPMLGRQNDP